MQQLQIANNEAPKIGGVGTLKYQLWVDDGGNLYVQITENSENGKISQYRFPVAKYASKRKSKDLGSLLGLDSNGNEHPVSNNNVNAFLRAVLLHLLDGEATP